MPKKIVVVNASPRKGWNTNPEAKQRRHDQVFPEECRAVHALGFALGKD